MKSSANFVNYSPSVRTVTNTNSSLLQHRRGRGIGLLGNTKIRKYLLYFDGEQTAHLSSLKNNKKQPILRECPAVAKMPKGREASNKCTVLAEVTAAKKLPRYTSGFSGQERGL